MAKNYLALFNELKARASDQPEHLNSRVLVIDGLNTFIRSYSVSPVTNLHGEHVGGISGFLLSVGHAIKTINPTRVIIVFDGKNGSAKRRALYSEYKSQRKLKVRLNRSETVDKQDNQLEQLMRLVEYLGVLPFTTVIMDNTEADDVIAYIAKDYFKDKDSQVFIMSSDKDFMQLVDQQVHVWSPTKKKLYYTDDVYEEFGVMPENFALYRALTGDASDNIPGVQGLGAKTLAERFPRMFEREPIHIQQFFDYATTLHDSNPKIKLYEKVVQSKADVETYYKIVQLSETMIAPAIRFKVLDMLNSSIGTFSKIKFHSMLIEDGMTNTIRNVDMWIREITLKLDQFALQERQ
jgi:5'-3' exonuclease